MGKISQSLKEEYERLKKIMDKVIRPVKREPQWVLQPVRPKKYHKGNLSR